MNRNTEASLAVITAKLCPEAGSMKGEKMEIKHKTILLYIKYEINEDEKEILDKYGYDFEKNAEQISRRQAKKVAYELKKEEEKNAR